MVVGLRDHHLLQVFSLENDEISKREVCFYCHYYYYYCVVVVVIVIIALWWWYWSLYLCVPHFLSHFSPFPFSLLQINMNPNKDDFVCFSAMDVQFDKFVEREGKDMGG